MVMNGEQALQKISATVIRREMSFVGPRLFITSQEPLYLTAPWHYRFLAGGWPGLGYLSASGHIP